MTNLLKQKRGSISKYIPIFLLVAFFIVIIFTFIIILNKDSKPTEVIYNLQELSDATGINEVDTKTIRSDIFEPEQIIEGNTKPIASFTLTTPVLVGETVTVTDHSYDKDLGGSIVNWHWDGKKDFYTKAGVYTITLKVQDDQGDWSEPVSHVVHVVEKEEEKYTLPPIACFKATNPVFVNETIVYEDCSYSPNGLAIVDREWSGKQNYFTSAGIYKVTLRVKDSSGKWSDPLYENIQVKERSVIEEQRRPIAVFDVTSPVYVGQEVIYTDKSFDPDTGDKIVKTEWSSNKQTVYNKIGKYDVSLRVKDNHGEWSETFTKTIEVISSPNTPPVANFKPNGSVFINEKVDWENTSYDTDGTIAREQWSGDKRYMYSEPGEYTITLTVWDDKGAMGTLTKKIKVIDKNRKPPVAKFRTNSPVSIQDRVYFYDDSYDEDGEITKIEWGGDKRDTYDEPGTYMVTLTVWDDDGNYDTFTDYIEVIRRKNNKPVAQIAGPMEIYVNQTVTFEDKSYDPDGYIIETSWGANTISKTWEKPGTYNVDLKVKDNYGEEDFVSIVVYVRDKNYPLGPNDY